MCSMLPACSRTSSDQRYSSYEERSIMILGTRVKEPRSSRILLVKVLWSNHGVEEVTWENEADMKEQYPIF